MSQNREEWVAKIGFVVGFRENLANFKPAKPVEKVNPVLR